MAINKRGKSGSHLFAEQETPLQVPRWSGNRAFISTGGSSARVALPTGATLIEIVATENCYIAFGDVTVTASSTIASDGSRLFLAGSQVVPVPEDSNGDAYTHIAAIQFATSGTLQVEELV